MAYAKKPSTSSASTVSPLECSICTDPLADPRVLPCGHSYCGPPKRCLEAVQRERGIRCAICGDESQQDIANLKPLFGIRDVLKELAENKSRAPQRNPNIPQCIEHPGNPIQFWCSKCNQKICHTCFEMEHDDHSLKPFRKHLQEKAKMEIEPISKNLKSFRFKSQSLMKACDGKAREIQPFLIYRQQLALENDKIDAILEQIDEVQRFICEPKGEVDLAAIESFFEEAPNLKDLQELICKADEIFLKNNVSLKTTFHCFVTETSYYGWEGGTELTHGNNSFRIQIAKSDSDIRFPPVFVSLTWKSLNHEKRLPFKLAGSMIVESVKKGDSKVIRLEGFSKDGSQIYVQKKLPVTHFPHLKEQKDYVKFSDCKYEFQLTCNLKF